MLFRDTQEVVPVRDSSGSPTMTTAFVVSAVGDMRAVEGIWQGDDFVWEGADDGKPIVWRLPNSHKTFLEAQKEAHKFKQKLLEMLELDIEELAHLTPDKLPTVKQGDSILTAGIRGENWTKKDRY